MDLAHGAAPHLGPADGTTGQLPLTAESPERRTESPEPLSPLNLPTLLAGLTWFGGVGYITTRTTSLLWTMILLTAVVGGLVGGGIIYLFFSRILWPAQTPPLDPADYQLPGTLGRVVSGIAAGGTGEIMYVKGGTRAVAGARSADGAAVSKGTEVIVVRYEHGLAYVLRRDAVGAFAPDAGQVTSRLPPSETPTDPGVTAPPSRS